MLHWPEESIMKKVYVPSKTSQNSDSCSSNKEPRYERDIRVIDPEDSNCDDLHSGTKLSPKELDNRALNARIDCNANEAIRVIQKISDSERTNVKIENGYLDGIKQRQKPDFQGPVMSRNQKECFPKRPPNKHSVGPEWQSYTNQHQERPQEMYKREGYNQQSNQYPGFNQHPNQDLERPQGMSANQWFNQQPNQHQGYNQQPNQHQGYNKPQNKYQPYNYPPHPQQYGQRSAGMMPPPLLPAQTMNQPQQNVQWNLNMSDHQGSPQRDQQTPDTEKQHKKKRVKKDKHNTEENEIQDPSKSEQTKQYEDDGFKKQKSLLSEEQELIKYDHEGDRGRGRGQNRGKGGHEYNENKIEKNEDENALGNQKRRVKGVDRGRGRGDAKICTQWNNKQSPGQCQNTQCDFFHICRRFITGNCKKSSFPLSHSFRNPHNRHLKDILGINDFSDADIKIVLNCNSPSVCADYIYNNGCKVENGEKRCPHLHLCEKKVFGKCKEKRKFRKTHSITQFHNKWVLGSWHMSGWQEARVLKSINVPPRQRKENDDNSDDSDLGQDEDDAGDASVRYDSAVNDSSESLSSTTSSGPFRKFNRLITSVENLNIEDVKERRKMKPGRRERFKLSEDIISGIVGKDDHGLPKISAPQHKYDDDDIKEKERLLMEKYKQEKPGTSSGKVVKPKPPPRPSKLSPSDPDYQERNPALLKDETENSKICIFVSKNQCPSASCKNLHLPSGIPYLWQIKMFCNWFSLTLAENEIIEKGYCDLLDVESTEVKYNGSKYSYNIWFSKMQAIIYDVDGQPVVGDNQHDQWCTVRRLSTPSFTEKKMINDSYLTQWRWYWKDDSKKWNMYNKNKLEYFFYYAFRTLCSPDSIQFPAAMNTAKPVHFYQWDWAHDFELVKLDIKGKEFKEVLKSLQDSMSPTLFETKFIFRIQNRKLWSEYDM
ncbi:PARP7S [Mytilus coruscus]|uniref:PARP7S n=1 Tax=Mytilus coruscus TaxID=42192 RepID=A0A6J8D075_MYTCO|nr:PARP7S [Mytilus coruscus]